jgi:hypothetical protein
MDPSCITTSSPSSDSIISPSIYTTWKQKSCDFTVTCRPLVVMANNKEEDADIFDTLEKESKEFDKVSLFPFLLPYQCLTAI